MEYRRINLLLAPNSNSQEIKSWTSKVSLNKDTFVYVRVNISIKPKTLDWLHFIKVAQNKAKYNICAKDIADLDFGGHPNLSQQ